jgi:Na+/H+-dicarboxylate symporter
MAALALGLGCGYGLNAAALSGAVWAQEWAGNIKIVGDMFIALIRMLIAPLIFLTLVSAVVSLGEPRRLGSIGLKSVSFMLVTTAIAVGLGLAIGLIVQPGVGVNTLEPPPMMAGAGAEAPTVAERLLGLIPENPIASLAQGEILQIILFALLFGVGLLYAREKGAPAARAIEGAAEGMIRLTGIIMELAPIGVFALMTWVAATYGLDTLRNLALLVGCVYAGCLIHALVVYGVILKLIGVPVSRFYGGIVNPLAIAFSTASSNATMPATLHAVERNLGVSNRVASFVVPLGATINMDGTALYLALAAVFGAQAFGITLDVLDYGAIVLASTLGAIGAAGIPGAGLIMMSIVLTAGGIPLEVIAIVAGVDRIMDMARTAVNVTGDCTTSVVVAKWEGELDEGILRGAKQPDAELVVDESPARDA